MTQVEQIFEEEKMEYGRKIEERAEEEKREIKKQAEKEKREIKKQAEENVTRRIVENLLKVKMPAADIAAAVPDMVLDEIEEMEKELLQAT